MAKSSDPPIPVGDVQPIFDKTYKVEIDLNNPLSRRQYAELLQGAAEGQVGGDTRIPFRGERPSGFPHGLGSSDKRAEFANLADEFRASLVDTRRMGYPLNVLEPEVRNRADAACRALLPVLHRAHRIVLDDGFTRLATALANSPPDKLRRLLQTARLPFNNLWLEWGQPDRELTWIGRNYADEAQMPKRVGVLIWPVDDEIFRLVAISAFEGQCAPAPIGMIFSMTQLVQELAQTPYDSNPAVQSRIDQCAIGWNYMEAVETEPMRSLFLDAGQAEIAQELSKYAVLYIAPPLGPLHRETIVNALAEKREDIVDRQREWLGITAREINGLWRFLIAVFGLYQTGGGEFVVSQSKKQERRMIRGGITLPAYEYRILKLARPTRPEIIEARLPAAPSGQGRREHTVGVSWHHRRLATAECARHPKVCEIAIWHKKIDPDTGEGVGKHKDQEECQICHRIRWLVPEHKRGDKKLGIVDKGYKIVSSMDEKHVRPSHETVEVVESLPPGVRIKSIPRFDAVTKHGADSHEHQGGRRHPRTE